MIPEWLNQSVKPINEQMVVLATARQQQLTKPLGSLGRMEQVAIRLAGLQGVETPDLERVRIVVFAADHGVAASGVSAFPQEVTAQMMANFAAGGAAISVLARSLEAELEVVDVGVLEEPANYPGVVYDRAAAGSANLLYQDAMTAEVLETALDAGRRALDRAVDAGAQLIIGGEMGIGNTTAAAAVACALLELKPETLVGPGTGLNSAGMVHKSEVIQKALTRYSGLAQLPLEALRVVGGLEIAALTGAYLAAAQAGIPVLVDGYITSAAALVAVRHNPQVKEWLLFSHQSAEPGHQAILEAMDAEPLINLGMRLGEGSGAATTLPLLRLACDLHNGMATFADAGVSEG